MDAYAVVEAGGKQYRVAVGQVFEIEKIDAEAGAEVTLDKVLAVSDGSALKVGAPLVEGAAVTVTVVEQFRGDKVVTFKKKRRKGYRRTIGHRQDLTRVQVKAIA